MATKRVNREGWLELAVRSLRPHFRAAGVDLPPVRVSVGWPGGRKPGGKKKVLGQCWAPSAAADSKAQVFISPVVADAPTALGVLVHELCHAADRNEHGHGREFAALAARVGLLGKPTETVPGHELALKLESIRRKLGKYPHAELNEGGMPVKKQTTRMIKVLCGDCGYTVRTTSKWLEVGTPICCTCEIPMVAESND